MPSLKAVATWQRPLQVLELHSFFTSNYRHFVEGFAKLAAPLHRLVTDLIGTRSKRSGM